MPRPLRVQAPGLYHLTAQGVRRSALLRGGRDRATLLDLVAELVQRYRWTCEAYCLMTTHYHLLVRTKHPNLAAGMQWLNGRWGQLFNLRHREVGHVFRARYASVLIEADGHAFEVVRYLALNPVRAGLCLDPLDWPWSSYAGTVDAAPRLRFLDPAELLARFSEDGEQARRLLRAFVADRPATLAA